MPRQGNHGPKTKEGNITWADVTELLKQMQQHLGMRVQIRHEVVRSMHGETVHQISAEAYRWENAWTEAPKHRAVVLFPNGSILTMPGAYVRALHSLDHVAWRQSELGEGEAF